MINAVLLCAVAIGISSQNVIKKFYSRTLDGRGAFVFSSVAVIAACLFFLFLSGFKLQFDKAIIPYVAAFASTYGLAAIASLFAMCKGALSLTALINSYSLIIPTLWGLIFLDEKVTVIFWCGIVLLMISLFLMNSKRDNVKISISWIVFVTLSFLGNGFCSVAQIEQQKAFNGAYKNEFMIFSLVLAAVILLSVAFFRERGALVPCIKRGGHLMLLCGVANGLVNLLVMLLVAKMNTAVMYPIISSGGIILSWTVSKFVYKENLTKKQNSAMVLGILSVVLMNL